MRLAEGIRSSLGLTLGGLPLRPLLEDGGLAEVRAEPRPVLCMNDDSDGSLETRRE